MESDDELRTLVHHDITAATLSEVRADTIEAAEGAGLDDSRAERFGLAVHEVAANSVEYADSSGELMVVQDDETVLYADVTDHGPGMVWSGPVPRPPVEAVRGRGLWLSQELTDRMQVDSGPDGTVVRLEMTLGDQDGVAPA